MNRDTMNGDTMNPDARKQGDRGTARHPCHGCRHLLATGNPRDPYRCSTNCILGDGEDGFSITKYILDCYTPSEDTGRAESKGGKPAETGRKGHAKWKSHRQGK